MRGLYRDMGVYRGIYGKLWLGPQDPDSRNPLQALDTQKRLPQVQAESAVLCQLAAASIRMIQGFWLRSPLIRTLSLSFHYTGVLSLGVGVTKILFLQKCLEFWSLGLGKVGARVAWSKVRVKLRFSVGRLIGSVGR